MHVNVEYPEVILNIKDVKAAIDAGDKVGDILERALFELDNDICIRSSEESGIAHREKILGINPRDTDSIEDRRLEVLLRWYDSPLYTETVLRQKMDATLGENQYVLKINLNTKTVFCLVELTRKRMQKSVIDMLDQMVPLDYLISVALRYNTWKKINENLTWQQALQKTWRMMKEEVLYCSTQNILSLKSLTTRILPTLVILMKHLTSWTQNFMSRKVKLTKRWR